MANSFYFDASALAKRYAPEKGSAEVDTIFDTAPHDRICVLNVGTGEVVSMLVRRRNAGVVSEDYFEQALSDFETEIVYAAAVTKASIRSRLITTSFPLIVTHSVNSTDAVTLKSALALAKKLRAAGDDLVLVASDQRLLRAAQAEALLTFDPETQDQAALAAVLGA